MRHSTQPASYHGGLGLSLLGHRVRPGAPPRRGGALLQDQIFISPPRTSTTSTIQPPVKNKRHLTCTTASKPPKTEKSSLALKINTIGEDIDSFEAVGKELMKIREANTVQQLQGLLHASVFNAKQEQVAKTHSRSKREGKEDLEIVGDIYESLFLVHHTALRDAIARVVDAEAVT